MPDESSEPPLLLDTSAAVALVTADHEAHRAVSDVVAGRRLGLCGHAAFETFSVLTRLPPPARRTAPAVGRLLTASFPHSRFLSPEGAANLVRRLADLGLAGGAVYDALVGAAAEEHDLTLLTRDRRALATYREIGVRVEVVR